MCLRHTIFWDIRLQKCPDLEKRVRGPRRSLKMSPFDRAQSTFYWRSKVTISRGYGSKVTISRVFSEVYSMSKNVVTLKSGLGVTQGHQNDTFRSDTHDILLTFHWPISYRFRHERQFQSKIATCSHPVNLRRCWRCLPWNWLTSMAVKKTRMMGLPGQEKSLTISTAVWIQCTNVTDVRTDRRTDTGRQKRPR